MTRDSFVLKGVSIVIVEFNAMLANGQAVHVVANVGESTEIESVVRIVDDVPVPPSEISWSETVSLEADAAAEYYERRRERKESA